MVNSKKLPANNTAEKYQLSQKVKSKVKLSADDVLAQVERSLLDLFSEQNLTKPHLLVALSGGLDSIVLLHVLNQLKAKYAFSLSALHVHHGLSVNADIWAEFCLETCKKLAVACTVKKIIVEKNTGLGIEATAREARYHALAQENADFICLAHHQDDQAETLLLQLARGAGAKGLAGMAKTDIARKLFRPLLPLNRLTLEAYAKRHRLSWIHDESNDDTTYDRNFMRHKVLPVLRERFPAITQTLSRSAQHLASATELIDDLAALDMANAMVYGDVKRIHLSVLAELTEARFANVMRWWLARNNLTMPSTLQMEQILQQLLHAKSDAMVKLKVSEMFFLRRYQDWAYLVEETKTPETINLLWQGEPELVLPNAGYLVFTEALGTGIAVKRNGAMLKLRIKFREGGEKFKPDAARPSRTLKQILQSVAMPPWQREALPLVFMDEQLVYVPNVGASAEMSARPDEVGFDIKWVPNAG